MSDQEDRTKPKPTPPPSGPVPGVERPEGDHPPGPHSPPMPKEEGEGTVKEMRTSSAEPDPS